MRIAFIPLAAVALLLSGCLVSVAFAPTPATLGSGASTPLSVTVMTRPNKSAAWAPAAPGTVTFSVDQAGTVSPTSALSAVGTGVATGVTFTAGPVPVSTPATITASYGRGSGSVTITVVPPTVTAPFLANTPTGPSTPVAGEDVSVAPTVRKGAGGWTYTYLVTPGTAGAILNTIDIRFAVPVTVTTSVGQATPYPSGRQGWQIANLAMAFGVSTVGLAGPITLTVTGDFNTGGTAAWDIVTRNLSGAPNMHATLTTVGPK